MSESAHTLYSLQISYFQCKEAARMDLDDRVFVFEMQRL